MKFNVTQQIRSFNEWFSEFMIEIAKPLLIIGFILGTVDVFTGGHLARQQWFVYAWAGTQAISIDGLFLAVWMKIFNTPIKQGWPLLIVGFLLVFAAGMVNNILTYQQVQDIGLANAMSALHIDVSMFTDIRAFLVVIVAVLVSFIANQRKVNESVNAPRTVVTEQAVHKAERNQVNKVNQQVLPVHTTLQISEQQVNSEQHVLVNGEQLVNSELNTIENSEQVNGEQVNSEQAVVNTEQLVNTDAAIGKKELVWQMFSEQPDASQTLIANTVGCSKSYVSKERAKFNASR